ARAATVRFALVPQPRVPRKLVDPRAHRGVAAKAAQTTPQVLAEFRERVICPILIPSDRRQVGEDGRAVLAKDRRSGRWKVVRLQQMSNLCLDGFHEVTLACD